jgi:hypothetical protein
MANEGTVVTVWLGRFASEERLDAPVESRASELGLSEMNTVVLVWDRQVTSPRSVRGPDYELQWIGTFPCDPSASSI